MPLTPRSNAVASTGAETTRTTAPTGLNDMASLVLPSPLKNAPMTEKPAICGRFERERSLRYNVAGE